MVHLLKVYYKPSQTKEKELKMEFMVNPKKSGSVKKAIAIFFVVFGFGAGIYTFLNFLYVEAGKDLQKDYKYVVENDCKLKGWLIQTIETHRTSKHHSYHTESNLPLDKYSSGLDVRVTKRLINEDGDRYSQQTSMKGRYTQFERQHKFTYHCKGEKTYKSYYGFFDRVEKKNEEKTAS